jgi:hypothetical protein
MGEVSAAVVSLIRILSGPVEDSIALAGGAYLHELNIRNADKLMRRTREILQERDAKVELGKVGQSGLRCGAVRSYHASIL